MVCRIGVSGVLHHRHIYLVVMQKRQTFLELGLLAHGRPHVGVEDIRARHARHGVMADFDFAAIAFGALPRDGKNLL